MEEHIINDDEEIDYTSFYHPDTAAAGGKGKKAKTRICKRV